MVYLEIFPAESPPQITVFFFENCKKKLITAILENSSFLAKTLIVTNITKRRASSRNLEMHEGEGSPREVCEDSMYSGKKQCRIH